MKRIRSLATLAGFLFVFGHVPESAGLGAPRLPSARTQLRTTAKKFVKSKSYRVKASIVGGISEKPDHELKQRTVKESYTGNVYKPVMHVPEVKAYRTLDGGTVYSNGAWKHLLADRAAVKCDRLFSFPEVLLGRALRHARTATWVKDPAAADAKGAQNGEKDSDPKGSGGGAEEETSRGKTTVAKPAPEEEEASTPRFILVETPVKEALKHVIEVENSGCLGGG